MTFATAIGSGAVVNTSNTIALGRTDGTDKVVIYGLGDHVSAMLPLCRNAANQIARCAVSGLRPALEFDAAKQTAMQAQIDAQTKQIAEQKAMIDALRALVCSTNATAAVCKAN